ncbi:lysophospholipase [Henriciella barbarensis]|uniref:Lysophospholipase n=1 Tax=Henriciella barbarensis TaxID=86342 RepID=A0A399QZ23_9PROT|nr:alpha/beta hydrolase [Henriciella barbarensis]RIJ23474.1 lysophospholipase [Henriciella barbarensis]
MVIKAEAWRFGAPVAGYAWRVEEAKANLLLMHGYGEYATRYVAEYNQLIPALNKAGFSVFAFDANGHGASPGPRGATDIKQAVHHHQMAREALTLESKAPVVLFGHSLGGLITAASVAGKPDGVEAVILSAPALEIELNPVLKALAGLIAAIAPAARLTPPLEADAISRDRSVVEAYRNNPDVITKPPAARLGATAVSVLEAAWKRFSAWQVPVLIIHGDADRLTPIEGSQRFFEMIGVSDKTLDVFEGGYHELLNDTERDRALAVILSWLERHVP